MSKESRLIKTTAIIAIGNICTKIISFFMVPLYTNLLTTEEYGTADLISIFISLTIIILTLQMDQGIFRYLIEARGDKEKQKEYITTTLVFMFVVNTVIIGIITLVLALIKYEYTIYISTTLYVNLWLSFLLQIPRGFGDNTTYTIGSFINATLNVLLNVLFLAVLKMKVEGILLAVVLSQFISVIYLFIKTKLWKYIKLKYYSKQSFKILLKFSLPMVPNTLGWWVVSVSDRLILKAFLGVNAIGIYTVANKFPTILTMFTNIFHTSWSESISENSDVKDTKEYAQKIVIMSTKAYSAANMLLISLLPFIFNFLIGKDFRDAYQYIPLLLTGSLFNGISNIYGSLFIAKKETKKIAKTTVISAIVNISVNLIFVKFIGIYAAAISTVLSYIIISIIRHFEIRNIYPIKYNIPKLILELIVYAVIFFSYYSKNYLYEGIALAIVVPYTVIQNFQVIKAVSTLALSKVKEKIKH